MTSSRGRVFVARVAVVGILAAVAVFALVTTAFAASTVATGVPNTGASVTGATAPKYGPEAASANASSSADSSSTPPRYKIPPGTQPYNMDFTLPTLGKAGCMVCHGDRNLIRVRGDQYVSYYVDDAVIRGSAHGTIMCTGCHVDFAYKAPHGAATWQEVSKQACKNCHQPQHDLEAQGAHAPKNTPGQTDPKASQKPLCGDCHGAHDIVSLKSEAAKSVLRDDGYQVCGRCHQQEWDNYADYYHGAAYKRGAADAPACWDCHGPHTVRPSSDPESPTNPENLAETCSGKVTGRSCHADTSEQFLAYASLIHHRQKALQENQLYATVTKVREGISAVLSNIVDTVRRLVG